MIKTEVPQCDSSHVLVASFFKFSKLAPKFRVVIIGIFQPKTRGEYLELACCFKREPFFLPKEFFNISIDVFLQVKMQSN